MISNSTFIRHYAGRRRRSQTLQFGRKTLSRKRARWYKLLNVKMLCDGIGNPMVCAQCKHSKSKLELFEEPKKIGLAEKLSWQCNLCHNITEFGTSTKVFTEKAVDGTWQKRGHTSKIGVVFVICVQTGEVLDYSVKCLVCH